MNRGKINYWIDVGLFISFLIVALSGIIKFPGWGLYQVFGFNNISRWHDWSGIALVILVFLHLILHWNWIVGMTKNIFRKGGEI